MGRPLGSVLASNGKYLVLLYAIVTLSFVFYLHQLHSRSDSAFLPGSSHHSHVGRSEQHLEIPKIIHQTWKTKV
jgi:mannosyltransferase OCH1-like enzyme